MSGCFEHQPCALYSVLDVSEGVYVFIREHWVEQPKGPQVGYIL